MNLPLPKDFSRFRVGEARVVAHESCVAWCREVIASGATLYDWAAAHPGHRTFTGRVPAYAVSVPNDGPTVVVRRAHHGGVLGPLRGDLFFPPTRAHYELLASYILANAGVRTPPVLAFAVYPAGWLMRRNDFVTMALPGRDLGEAFLARPEAAERRSWLAPLGELVRALTRAGAWHQDLNVRNIMLVPDGAGVDHAFVLDIDRVRFVPAGDPNVRDANMARLERSVRKWRALHGLGFEEEELRELRALASAPAGA